MTDAQAKLLDAAAKWAETYKAFRRAHANYLRAQTKETPEVLAEIEYKYRGAVAFAAKSELELLKAYEEYAKEPSIP